jgi:integrase
LAVRLVVEDGLPYRIASWHLWRDHRVFVPFATIQKAQADAQTREVPISRSLKDVKTAKGRRRIDLSRDTLDTLADHRRAMLAEGHIDGPVFCDSRGGYLRMSNLRRNSFKPILSKAGLPSVRLDDLRHTSATLLLLADQPAKVVSERLGHASIQVTLDTYSHVLPTLQKRAAETAAGWRKCDTRGGPSDRSKKHTTFP